MNKSTHRPLILLAVMLLLATASGAMAETEPAARGVRHAMHPLQKQSPSGESARQAMVTTRSPAADDTHGGDPKLLRELIEQADREVRDGAARRALLAATYAELTASFP